MTDIDNKNMESLKKKIEEAYIEYRSDLSSKRRIDKLASYFKIPIDTSRLEDYYVRFFDKETTAISIYDKKTDTIYNANYTMYSQFLSSLNQPEWCLETSSIKDNTKLQKLYRAIDDGMQHFVPYLGKLTITHGKRELAFERKYERQYLSEAAITHFARPFTMEYASLNLNEKGVLEKNLLYTKTLTPLVREDHFGIQERYFISSNEEHIWNHFVYLNATKTYYLIDSCNCDSEKFKIFGYAKDINRTTVSGYTRLVHFLINFNGIDENYFDIQKSDEYLIVTWRSKFGNFDFALPISQKGALAYGELEEIIGTLQTKYGESEPIQIVIQFLREFASKLKSLKNLEKGVEQISLEQFEQMPFDGIQDTILKDIDGYFECVEQELADYKSRMGFPVHSSTHPFKPVD